MQHDQRLCAKQINSTLLYLAWWLYTFVQFTHNQTIKGTKLIKIYPSYSRTIDIPTSLEAEICQRNIRSDDFPLYRNDKLKSLLN